MAKHTKGPWTYEETDEGHLITLEGGLSNNGGPGIPSHCEIEYNHLCFYEDNYPEDAPCNVQAREAEANVRLMCAAPELLDACKAVLAEQKDFCRTCGDSCDDCSANEVIKLVTKAIAKYEGKEHA